MDSEPQSISAASGSLPAQKVQSQLPEDTGSQDCECKESIMESLTSLQKPISLDPVEFRLQALWSSVLALDLDNIKPDDSFLRLGGDSIAAMKLVGTAREQGLLLSAADVFRQPTLHRMAGMVRKLPVPEGDAVVAPFTLLEEPHDVISIRNEAAIACQVEAADIEDVFPCTPLQEGLLALTTKHPGDYVARYAFRLLPTTNVQRLRSAWIRVVAANPILRTRIIDIPTPGLVQVIMKHSTMQACQATNMTLAEYLALDRSALTGLGSPLVRSAVLQESHADAEPSRGFFVWTVHHAVYDGWSKTILLQQLAKAYHSAHDPSKGLPSVVPPQFQAFVKHIKAVSEDELISFWFTQFEDLEAEPFPLLPSPDYQPRSNEVRTLAFDGLQWPSHAGVTPTVVLRAAWSILISKYTNAKDTLFGVTVSGRQTAFHGVEQLTGPTIATVPLRVILDPAMSVQGMLLQIQQQAVSMTEYEQAGLQTIRRVSPQAARACDFNSLLVIQPRVEREEQDILDSLFVTDSQYHAGSEDGMAEFRTYPLSLECQLHDDNVGISVRFDPAVLGGDHVVLLMQQLGNIVRQLCDARLAQTKLADLDCVSQQDLEQIWRWNLSVPLDVETTVVHDLIAETTKHQPGTQAICAWDGEWTYRELDELSTCLAHQIMRQGVKPGVIVPLCIEKSKWMPVAMVAVMKAGGASIALDYVQPEQRLLSIMRQVSPVIILISAANEILVHRLTAGPVLVVDERLTDTLTLNTGRALPVVQPSDMLYLVFTSGSTGEPKGVVVTHANITSAIFHQRGCLGFSSKSRVFDFASYMFDVVWCNLLQGLSAGACICIPSNDDRRNDIVGAAIRLSVNTAILTPSIARGLDMKALENLTHVLFIGEPLSMSVCDGLPPNTVVTNLYGPTECTTFSTAQVVDRTSSKRISIGTGLGLNTWLVDPSDDSKLVPRGCTGELLLEGPLVAAGYFGKAATTATVFVNGLAWLLENPTSAGAEGRRSRLYKTGDLARYNIDGTLEFLGRRDSQVKLNGQRVELGDIEHHIKACLEHSEDIDVVATVAKLQASNKEVLVAFLKIHKLSSFDDMAFDVAFKKLTNVLNSRLGARVPAYMIPLAYIPLDCIPTTPSGKTDRPKLQSMAQRLSFEEVAETTSDSSLSEKRQPSTDVETCLQSLWAAVLGQEALDISAADSFLRIGGDSISVMRLVAAARKQGLALSAAEVFQHPILSDMALAAQMLESSHIPEQIAPFTLMLKAGNTADDLRQQIASLFDDVEASQVEDAFPCTPLQEGLLALTSRRFGDYVAQFVYMLQSTVDVQQFMQAWETVVEATPILRTHIIDVPGHGLIQTIISQPAKWTHRNDTMTLRTYRRADRELATGLSTPLTRYTVLRTPEDGSRYFVWTIHHALYDSWSIPLILERLEGSVAPLLPSPPFQSFVKHITEIDKSAAAKYWEQQFQGLEAQIFPQLPSNNYQPLSTAFIKRHLHVPHWPDTGITPSNVLRAAWSLLASKYTDGAEVIFGVTVAGRQAAVTDVERMMGPTIATVPVRITLDWSQMTVEQLLRQVQAQSAGMIAYEQMGLQHIRRISPEAERACQFQTLLVVHAAEEDEPQQQRTSSRWFISKRDEYGSDDTHVTVADTHALTLECDLQRHGLRLRAAHDTNVIDADRVQRLAVQLEHVIQQLCASSNASKCLSRLNMLCEQDAHDIRSWNAVLPEADDSCLHDLVTETARKQPQAIAINAWDGDYTYQQFDESSSLLAKHLISRWVGRNAIVPLYFRKSKWNPVAMLGVMKAGGASVMMDSRQPPERMKSVLDQIKPVVFITSAGDEKLVSSLSDTPTIVLNDKLMREIASSVVTKAILPRVQPSDTLYLIFTSGSTGTPKGAQISHSNVCSALRYQRQAHGYTSDARVYDFGSYAFDSVWVNFMSTFTIGGCLCIPSEQERSDDLAASIKRFNPTILDITPSAATVLDDSTIASLRTLILGGERLTSEYAKRWSRLVDIRLPYGPCECTPTATIATINPNHEGEPNIGHGAGCLTWITDTEEGKTLVPIGTIGELVLEGPLVGLGYLGDEAKTAAAFIERPLWLSAVGQDRRGPFYRTGDLVRYNLDGTLMFVGRKDGQIKIHGQRVELAEIEGFMARHVRTRQSAALYPQTRPFAKKLVGLFDIYGCQTSKTTAIIELIDADADPSVVQHILDLEALLRECLPPYMVPSIWVPLKDLPLNASGKLNRHLLEDWLCHLDSQTVAKIDSMSHLSTTVEPQTHRQHILRSACGDILNSSPAEIDVQRSFVANGGDSISAMRLSSYCRTLGLTLSVSSLLKGKSLSIVADSASMDAATPVLTHVEVLDKAFGLSPIQRWFFDQAPREEHINERHHYNQGFYVKMSRFVSPERLSVAMRKIVQHHSMLRVRFTRSESGWTQSAPRVEDTVYNFSSADAQSLSEISSNAIELHQSLNFEQGPVFATALYHLTTENVQYLILVAHHLVVDLVSWRIILDDLEALLSNKELMHSTSFQVWTQLQAEEARSPRFSPKKVLSTANVHDNLDFWNFDERTSNTTHDHITKTFEADLATTSLLLKDSNTAFNSEPVDIILAAVWDAFFQSFPERTGLTIFNEGHGREPLTDTAIDLSRTVGWFTTLSPLHVDRRVDDSIVHTVRLVKDARRRLPINGLAYWVSRFLNPDGIKAFESHNSPMEVQFNYLGQFQQLERTDSLFTAINLDDAVPATSPHMPTSVLFDINVIIEAGVAKFFFAWNRHIDHQDSILAWIAQIVPSLQSICNELRGRPTSRTLCDFKFLSLDYSGLDELQNKILPHLELLNDSHIEDVLPCLPMVDGILLSQTKGTGSYETSQTWQIVPRDSNRIEASRLVDAWQTLIARHSALRTVFIESMDATRSAFNSAVLRSHRSNVLLVESESYEGALDTVKHLPRVDYTQPRPPHRLTLCSISGQPHILCHIEISHAICDGASTTIIMKDWLQAYSGELDVRELQDVTRDFTLALAAHSRAETTAYWKDKLSNMEPCTFPHLRGHTAAISSQPNGVASLEIRAETLKLVERFCKLEAVTPASFFQSAWTLVLSAYVASNRVCFGYLASGRQLPVKGIVQSIGAYANVMICRTDLGRQFDKRSLVHYIYEQVLEDMAFQHCSVAEIQHELGLPSLFNTIMSFQKEEGCVDEQDPEHQELHFVEVDWRDPTEYDITININQSKMAVQVTAEYRLSCMNSEQAYRVISLLESTIISLATEIVGPSTAIHRTLQELTATRSASVDDLRDVWNWNKIVPETVDSLVHHAIADVARRTPSAPAICAWDGNLTYSEFEAAAKKLAQHLVSLGVRPKVIVPLCFEKSKWMPVSMFAVMKAGAASLAIDCTLPRERLRSIVQQVHPLVVLASVAQTELAKQLTDRPMVVISDVHLKKLAEPAVEMPEVGPSDQLYIVFTSGSTGVPKGVTTTHSNFSSAIRHQQTSMGFKNTSRVYDFVKYAFDVTWSNFLHTMTSGGCLCIPSETEAIDNLADSFLKYRANFVDLTPSVASTIRPADLPALNHLLFSGEVLHTHIGAQWAEQATVLNTYGPAECSVKATFARIGETEAQVANIGRGFGLCTWIVQPINHDKLVPIGVVGELLLEGPLIGAGYLGDTSRTQTAFIENPPWLVRGLPHDASSGAPGHPGRCGRLYKTGDLVRYEPDGTMTFVGRNNAQVKINGQRVELGDVEYHVRNNIAIADVQVQVFAEILTPSQSDTSILMVFIHVFNERHADDSALDHTGQTARILTGLNERLAAHVSAHMIPSAYLVLKELPMTTTGKADRRRLREIGQKLTFEQIMALSSGSDGGQLPRTATERQLRSLWTQVLGIRTSETIKADHNFFQVGGNSITAMKLVGLARQVGLHLTVTSIFKQPILRDMARSTGQVSGLDEDDIPPFSLLNTKKDPRKLLEQAAELCQVDIARIEDIFPCTPLQEGLLALTAKRAGDYTAQYILPLRRSVDLARFQRAWEEVLRTTPTLRSRIVDLADQGLVQVILDHNVQWSHHLSVSEHQEVDKKAEISLGKPLVRYANIPVNNQSQTHCFAWTVHHALYDGWSMRLIMDRLNQAYQDPFALQPAPPFNRFVRHILNIEEGDANNFWQAQFAGLEAHVFPTLPSAAYQPRPESWVIHHIEEITWPRSSITAATAIRSSWSILTARLTNSSDVVFGVTMSGRQAAVHQISEMTGPTLTTLPVRTIFDWEQSVEAHLDQVQREMTEMIPYEQTGLQNISRISNECRQACNFQSLLLIDPFKETKDPASLLFDAHYDDDAEEVASGDFTTYALTLECELEEHGLKLKFEYDDGVISGSRVSKLADQFERILCQLCNSSNSTKRIAEIEVVSKTELDIIWTWNAKLPTTIEARVHDLIADACLKQPHATAIHAWDGIWTYAEVHDMSTCLAHHLVSH